MHFYLLVFKLYSRESFVILYPMVWVPISKVKKMLTENKRLRRRRPPLNSTSQDDERKVYWLDLFFDLAFVVAIGQISHLFHDGISLGIIIDFLVLTIPVRWLWVWTVTYNERFEDVSVRHRIMMFALMVPVLGMWVAVHKATGDLSWLYVSSYILGRLFLNYMYRSAWKHTKSAAAKKFTKKLVIGLTISAIIRGLSLLLPLNLRYLVWLLAIGIEAFVVFRLTWVARQLPDFHYIHLKERFGLFTIIVLAEIIINGTSALQEVDVYTLTFMGTVVAEFAIACLLRWIYFDQINFRPFRRIKNITYKWIAGHLPMVLGVIMTSGALLRVWDANNENITSVQSWTIIIGLSVTLLSVAYLAQLHKATDDDRVLDFWTDKAFNKRLLYVKLWSVAALIIMGLIVQFDDVQVWLFMLVIVLIMLASPIESLLHWVNARVINAEDGINPAFEVDQTPTV